MHHRDAAVRKYKGDRHRHGGANFRKRSISARKFSASSTAHRLCKISETSEKSRGEEQDSSANTQTSSF